MENMDFLEVVTKRNPALIQSAVRLYQEGKLSANTVVIDLDVIERNAQVISESANKHGLKLYFMTKQFGRNPEVCNVIRRVGIDSAVAVDLEDARCLVRDGIPVGHVGHLVQIPKNDVGYVLECVRPEVITVFNLEKARHIGREAKKRGMVQKILLRIVGRGDFFYPNQFGGIWEDEIEKVVSEVCRFDSLEIAGVTSFPCFRFNLKTRKLEALPNLATLLRVAERLWKMDVKIEQINTPGDNSALAMELAARLGATHVEPGHAFTGTTPWHAFEDLPEVPAWIYVTEVAHIDGDRAYAIGGGLMSGDAPLGVWDNLYHGHRLSALVGDNPDTILERRVSAFPTGYIDYYGELCLPRNIDVNVGDVVVYGFRNQVFVSRARVAVVSGVQGGILRVVGTFDREGRLVK